MGAGSGRQAGVHQRSPPALASGAQGIIVRMTVMTDALLMRSEGGSGRGGGGGSGFGHAGRWPGGLVGWAGLGCVV